MEVTTTMAKRKTLAERFWEKVDKDGPTLPGMDSPCWLWTGATHRQGYGEILIDGVKKYAHVIGWVLQYGPVPEGHDVLHRCDNPPCVRHLFNGTHQDNMSDMVAKGRSATGARNGRHTHSERTARGDRHGSHTHPESVARGDRHGFRLHPGSAARGEDAGRAKLTEANVLEIRRRYRTGESQSALAREFGLSSRNVCSIVRGESWKHLPL